MGGLATAQAEPAQRLRLAIHGAVQGVGCRPFLYRLAKELRLTGWVRNDTSGVCLELEGPEQTLQIFLRRAWTEKPPQARVEAVHTSWLAPVGYESLAIRHSLAQGPKSVLIMPDLATCADCLADVDDPANRRAAYPFTNCTNCGPRFTIIQALPYDRPHTTMRHFRLCPACQAEYTDPANRRFHAQPNACPECGPQLALWNPVGATLAVGAAAIDGAVAALRAGQILAVKGLGGFHLLVDARQHAAIARLRDGKSRPHKPLALMVPRLEQVRQLCDLPMPAEAFLVDPAAPILLLKRCTGVPIADNVAPGTSSLGVMLPHTPLHHLLLRAFGEPVVATSGNVSHEPICTEERDALQRLGHLADVFLVHNRPIARPVDDSVAWVGLGGCHVLRRARGYAPLPVRVQQALPPILAVGGHLKNTLALSIGPQIVLSQHLGDLDSPATLHAFERTSADLLRLYAISPVAIAHDLHPDYASTRWAQAWRDRCRLLPVQHHHAHFAACLAENQVTGTALGVTWDGTGYGLDGTVWGGEFLQGSAAAFTRVAHLRPFGLPGGEAAVREPRRVALAVLWDLFGEAAGMRADLAPVRAFTPRERRVLCHMLARQLNTPKSTSMGRLFDALASLMGLCQQATFEGQAAMALEAIADPTVTEAYPMGIDTVATAGPLVLDWRPLIAAVLDDLRRHVALGVMAARVHCALAEVILAVARHIGEAQVALTGGCFQNRLLTEYTARRLRAAGFRVLLHQQVPPNDGGLSLGQVMVAAARLAGE